MLPESKRIEGTLRSHIQMHTSIALSPFSALTGQV